MKQKVLVVTGFFILAGVCALWIYLLFFGVPESRNDIFADFGFPVDTSTAESERPVIEEQATYTEVDTSGELVQLTTKPVAGWTSITVGTSTERVVFAEQGTGHVYELDIGTGVEQRIDATTVAGTHSVHFAPDAETAVFVTNTASGQQTLVRSIATDPASGTYVETELPPTTENIYFTGDTIVRYTHTGNNMTTGYSYDAVSDTQSELFTVPFSEVTAVWSSSGPYIYNDPAPHFSGTLYQVAATSLTSVLSSAYNLVAMVHPLQQVVVYTAADVQNDTLESYTIQEDGEVSSVPLLVIPEKCTFSTTSSNLLWCAAPSITSAPRTALTDWYKGVTQFEDNLWRVNLDKQTATFLQNPVSAVGRAVDVDIMTHNRTETRLYFRNKIDNTLWLYNISS